MARAEIKVKQKVKLKTRKLSNGDYSYYIEYGLNGKRYRESLGLYITNATTEKARQQNKQDKKDAEEIRAEKNQELTRKKFGMPIHKSQRVKILEFAEVEKNKKTKGTSLSWKSLINYLQSYCTKTNNLYLSEIDIDFCNGFIVHLKENLKSSNTQKEYLNKFKTLIKQATTQGYIHNTTLISGMDKIKGSDTEIVYLIESEVKTLFKHLDKNIVVQRAFLFSCLTSLRFVDIKSLTNDNIQDTAIGKALVFTQSKTKKTQTLGLTSQAMELIGVIPEDSKTPLFPLGYAVTENRRLKQWTKESGITKDFTFHTGRHTFACMQLTFNTDLYTVSKLMGHTSIVHTQRYAKVLDKTKMDAMHKFPTF